MRPSGGTYQPLVPVLSSTIIGVLCDRCWAVPLNIWLATTFAALIVWFALWSRCWCRLSGCFLLGAACALAGSWHHVCWRLFRVDHVAVCTARTTSPICCEALVLSVLEQHARPAQPPLGALGRSAAAACRLRITRVRDARCWQVATGECEFWVRGSPNLTPGDRIRLLGRISAPSPPGNPGELDIAALRRCDRRLRRIFVDDVAGIRVITGSQRWHPRWFLPRLRKRGCELLRQHIGESRANLAVAILLGARRGISPERSHDFMVTGTIHLLAISGLHVGILAAGFWGLGRLGVISRRLTLKLIVLFVCLYALLTDGQPPVVRAGVLISLVCAARYSGRQSLGLNSLAAAGLMVLFLNPASLFRLGTQFSFLAVATLATIRPVRPATTTLVDPVDRLIEKSRPPIWRLARRLGASGTQMVWATSSVWLVTAPLVATYFHVVTPVSLLLNPLVWLPMAAALFLGLGVLLFGSWLSPVAALMGAGCDASLACVERMIEYGERLPGGHVWIPSPPTWWLALFYVGVSVWILWPSAWWSRRSVVLLATAWLSIGLLICAGGRRVPACLAATFIAVGHGTSVLLELPDGQVWLYDAGRLGNARGAVRQISNVLWQRRIQRLDGIILSHADADHYNAVPGLLDRFAVRAIYVSPLMFRHPTAAVAELRAAIDRHRVPLCELTDGDRISPAGRAWLEVLHPPLRGVGGSDNANSVVVRVVFAGRTLLLPGDLEPPGSARLLEQKPQDCDVLMAPHHGSLNCDPAAFVRWSNPEWVVISAGAVRASSKAKQAYALRGARVMHTNDDGAIRICLSEQGVSAQAWKSRKW